MHRGTRAWAFSLGLLGGRGRRAHERPPWPARAPGADRDGWRPALTLFTVGLASSNPCSKTTPYRDAELSPVFLVPLGCFSQQAAIALAARAAAFRAPPFLECATANGFNPAWETFRRRAVMSAAYGWPLDPQTFPYTRTIYRSVPILLCSPLSTPGVQDDATACPHVPQMPLDGPDATKYTKMHTGCSKMPPPAGSRACPPRRQPARGVRRRLRWPLVDASRGRSLQDL